MSSRPTSPRAVMKMYRLSAVLPFLFAVVSFALTLVFVLAGRKPGELEGQFLVSVSSLQCHFQILEILTQLKDQLNQCWPRHYPIRASNSNFSSSVRYILSIFKPFGSAQPFFSRQSSESEQPQQSSQCNN